MQNFQADANNLWSDLKQITTSRGGAVYEWGEKPGKAKTKGLGVRDLC